MKYSVEGCDNSRYRASAMCNACRMSTYRYGITTPQKMGMLEGQNSRCKICRHPVEFNGKNTGAVVDHCHTTGKVRGILCHECNTLVGVVENKRIKLELIAEFLGM